MRDPVQRIDDRFELLPQVLPAVEIVVDRRSRRKLWGWRPPLAVGAVHIEQRVEDVAQIQASAPLRGQQQLDNLPQRVSKGLVTVNQK